MSNICVGRISAATDAYKTNWSPVCVNSYDRPLLDLDPCSTSARKKSASTASALVR
jgi:hypothetical protein